MIDIDIMLIGSCIRVISPLIVFLFSSRFMGKKHFAIRFGQNWAIVNIAKYMIEFLKLNIGLRPNLISYNGMPSAHTALAWGAASYVRMYFGAYKFLAIPLYGLAGVTALSRFLAKKHNLTQIIVACIVSEIINGKPSFGKYVRNKT